VEGKRREGTGGPPSLSLGRLAELWRAAPSVALSLAARAELSPSPRLRRTRWRVKGARREELSLRLKKPRMRMA